MARLLRNQWVRTALVGVVMAVLGAALAAAVASRGSSASSVGDRVMLTTGGSIPPVRWASSAAARREEELPLSAAEAVSAGWKDPVLCSVGRGRYFQREAIPYYLLFNHLDELIGIYLFSETEMPAPWTEWDDLRGGGSLLLLEEHWALIVYFKDPARACKISTRNTVDQGYQTSAVKSTPTPYVAPTPTPAPAAVLEAAAKRMSSLSSLSFILTAEPEGTPLMPDIQAHSIQGSAELPSQVTLQATDAAGATSDVSPGSLPFDFTDLGNKIGAIARAMQGPEDTARQWIDNVPSRGAAGTVLGEHLASLVPSVSAEAQLTVQMWFDTDGLVRRVRIEGPLAPDDPTNAARVLEMRDFE